jgi:sugar (pentulose or hexulose) kinase
LGAALVAGYGVGLFRSLDTVANDWIRTGRVVRPDRKRASHYESRVARYRRLLELLQAWS